MKHLALLLLFTATITAQTKPNFTDDGRYLLLPIERIPNVWRGLMEGDSAKVENKRLKTLLIESNEDILAMEAEFERNRLERERLQQIADNAQMEAEKLMIDNATLRASAIPWHRKRGWLIGLGFVVGVLGVMQIR